MGELFLFDDLFPPLPSKEGDKRQIKKESPGKAEEKKEGKKGILETSRRPSLIFSDGKNFFILEEKNTHELKAEVMVYGTDLKAFVSLNNEEKEITFPFFLWNQRKDLRDLSEKVFEEIPFF